MTSPSRMPSVGPDDGEGGPLGQHLPHDRPAAHADGAKRGDLAEPLVHRDGEQRRDEQHGDDQAHAAEDVGELPEVDQALAEVCGQVGDAVDLELGESRPQRLGERRDLAHPRGPSPG